MEQQSETAAASGLGLRRGRAGRNLPFRIVDGLQELLEVGRVLDRAQALEGGTKKAHVALRQKTNGDDAVGKQKGSSTAINSSKTLSDGRCA